MKQAARLALSTLVASTLAVHASGCIQITIVNDRSKGASPKQDIAQVDSSDQAVSLHVPVSLVPQ